MNEKAKEVYSLTQLNAKFIEFERYGKTEDALEDRELNVLRVYYVNLRHALEPVQSVHTASGASFHLAMIDVEYRINILERWMDNRGISYE